MAHNQAYLAIDGDIWGHFQSYFRLRRPTHIVRADAPGVAALRFDALRVDALRIDAKRHNCTILLFSNGRGIVMGQSSRKVAEMAVLHWVSELSEEGALA